jgi:hypothetical protein
MIFPPSAAFADLMGSGEREEKSMWTWREDSFMVETVNQDRLNSEKDRLNTTRLLTVKPHYATTRTED